MCFKKSVCSGPILEEVDHALDRCSDVEPGALPALGLFPSPDVGEPKDLAVAAIEALSGLIPSQDDHLRDYNPSSAAEFTIGSGRV